MPNIASKILDKAGTVSLGQYDDSIPIGQGIKQQITSDMEEIVRRIVNRSGQIMEEELRWQISQ